MFRFALDNPDTGRTETVYDLAGNLSQRIIKRGPQGETPLEKDQYYYHPDHLGSSSYISDAQGQVYEHLEYFPFGETWVEEASNTQRTPYLFTSKELDEETGLYYFGARYYDPRTSVWQSADPTLDEYLDGERNDGVFNAKNLGLYSYAYQNPVRLVDSDGNNPGLVYVPGVFPQVDYRTGNAVVDNTALGAVNTVINTANSLGNMAVHALGAVGEALPDPGAMQSAGQAFPGPAGPIAGSAAGAVTRGLSALGRLDRAGVATNVARGAGKEIGILCDAAKGKGNFGLGSGTRAEADKLGRAWVGDGYKVASDGKALVSKDELRQYRPPSYKPKLDKTQANFEQRFSDQQSSRWQSNGHLDITD